ncbi:MAG TPA: N-acetylmuramoyl-L-alanine amidase [Firmicutes bacterium]|nr:N-acetylmuramoyl-L-alanine amidase [Bacillota bacterium]
MALRRAIRRPVIMLLCGRRRLALLSLLALAGLVIGGSVAAVGRLSLSARPLAGRVIALDPGHGSIDSGATHPESPLAEKEIVLDVAQRLARLIRRAGGRAVLTRTDDWESDLPDRAELQRRAGLAEAGRAEVLLSLHVDSHSDPSCRYGQIFYHPSSAEGKRLAAALQEELTRLQPGNYRRATPGNLYLLGCTKIPSVLVELGFLSHPEERRLLNTAAYREALAEALLRGIVAYLDGKAPKPLRKRPPASAAVPRSP